MKPILALVLAVCSFSVFGQDGTKDNSFGSNGVATTVLVAPNGATANTVSDITKIIVQPDGKIVQVGYKSSSTGDDFIVIRYSKDGAADLSFGNTGAGWTYTDINGGNDRAHSGAIQSDGKIVVAGEAVVGGKNIGVIVRYTTTGSPDPTFGTGGIVRSDLFTGASGFNAIAIQPDGKIVVAGFGTTANSDFFVARYLSNGTLDASFGVAGKTVIDLAAGNDAVTDLKLMDDGRIVLGGYARSGATDAFALARLTSSGLPDASFNGTGFLRTTVTGQGRSIAVGTGGIIYITGLSGNQFTTASYQQNGSVNSAFGGTGVVQTTFGATTSSRSVMLQCDGKLVVGGETSGSYALARYLPNGSLDPSFNGTGKATYNTVSGNRDMAYSGLAAQGGKILIGGISFTLASGYFRFNPTVLRLNNTSVLPNLVITNPPPVCSPSTVNLTAASVTAGSEPGLVFSYWTDTTALTPLSNPSAVNTSGTYYIKGTNAAGCSSVKPVTVTINTPPSGGISPASATICSGQSTLLTTSGGTSYQWKLNGTDIPGATSATYSATQGGSYSVMIFSGGCSAMASNTAFVTEESAPTGTITPSSATICQGGFQTLMVGGGKTYQWRKDGVDIPGATAGSYNATAAGTYTVLIISDVCSAPASNSAVITVSPPPSGSISPASGSICPGGNILLTVTGGTSYQWKKDGVDIAGETSSTYQATQPGTYTATIFNGSCSGPASNSAVITASSAPSGSISPASGSICPGASIALTVTGGTSYQWKKDGVDIAGATSATYNATQPGTYTATIINGSCSGPASNSSVITASSAPSGSISPASGSICPGGSIALTVTGGTSYQWKKDGVDIAGATSATYNATQPGTYTATIINGSCSGPASNSAVITASSSPSGSISPASGSICPGASIALTVTGGTSYQWKKDGVDIAGATSATYNATQPGTYTATIINGSCSGPASNSAVITASSSPSGSISPASGSICPGGSIALTVTGGTSYLWKKDGVDIAGATSATYNATQPGTYTATIINGSCSGPASNSSVITASSAPSGSISPASGSICPGGSIALTVTGGTSYQWKKDGVDIAGATSATYNATQPGTYTATIINGSCSGPASNSSVITASSAPSGSISPASGSICPGGSIALTVTGGTSYQWKKDGVDIAGATSATYNATQPGTYTATIINGSCSGPASNSAVITTSSLPSGSISPASGSICPGGSVVLTVTGGTSYQWTKDGVDIAGATSSTYTATDAGTYTATIINGSCSGPASNSAVVTSSSSPSGSISPASGSICPGGSIALTVTGGTSYQWKKDGVDIAGATSATYNATQPGTYTATIINGSCSGPASNSAVITASSSPSGSISPASGSICPGGSIALTVTGGTSYQWKKDGVDIAGATSATYNVTQPGTYTATIINGSCSGPASNSAVITASSSPSGSISPASGSICPGGSVVLTVTGGTSYQWKKDGVDIPGATSSTYTATDAGTYTATIINGSCSGPASNSAVITTSSLPSGSISPASGSICPGGSIALTVTGGTSYQWKKDGVDIAGATSDTYNATQPGTYTATIINGSCSGPASNSAVVTSSSSPSGSIFPASGSICPGGSLVLTVTGGTSYQWKKDGVDIAGATSATYNATQPGTYTATIINGSCSGPASNSAVITTSSSPSGSISPATGSICTGGSVVLTVTGGTSYQWKKDGVDIAGATSATFTATEAGTYTATIINGSCSGPASNSAVITTSSLPSGSISPASGSICPGGSVVLTVTGGTSYQWTKDGVDIAGATSSTYTATDAGTYTATIINGSCSGPASNSAVVTSSSSPSGSISPASGSICPGGSVVLTVTGGTSYQWKKDGVDIPGATSSTYTATDAGTYTATIINGSCSGPASNSAVITTSSSPSGSISPASGSICPGGSVVLTVTGGTSYQWKKDGVDIAGATSSTYTATDAGTYTATIINGSCSGLASNSSVITATSAPSGSISPVSGSICPGGSLVLTVTGGTSYQWKKDGVDITGATSATYNATQPGTYTATIINGSCSGPASNSSVITTSSSPSGSISPASGSICPGGSISLTVTGGTSYQWKKDGVDIAGATSNTYNATLPGTYTATIFNGSCSEAASNSAVLTAGSSPTGNITPSNATICEGNTAPLTATGGSTYQWLRNNVPIPGETNSTYYARSAGTYKAIVYNAGCQGTTSDSAVVSVTPLPAGTITPSSATICPGGSKTLKTNGGTSYQWLLNGTEITGAVKDSFVASQPGTYSAIIFRNGCADTASNTALITVNDPSSMIAPATATICPGASVTLNISGGDIYQWFRDGVIIPGATGPTYVANQAGSYHVRITRDGCTAVSKNNSIVTLAPLPVGTVSPRADSICLGEVKVLTAIGGTSYQWYLNGNVVAGAVADTINAGQPGKYTVMISNATCTAMASNSAVITRRVEPRGTNTIVNVSRNTAFLLPARSGLSYMWSPSIDLSDPRSSSPLVTTTQDRMYLVKITQAAGCPVTDTVHVRVFDAPEIYVPTAFTPNNDGKNDLLRPVPVNIKEIVSFQVYNRNGELVFKTNKLNDGWNGVFRGKPQPNGVFVWIFDGIDSEGRRVTAKGTSLLIR